MFNGLGYACVYLAEQTLTGGLTAVICASSPLFTLLVARAAGAMRVVQSGYLYHYALVMLVGLAVVRTRNS